MANLLAVQGLRAHYGATQILNGLDFTLQKGEFTALMGRNGMGKTTLIRALMGLGARRSGAIMVKGQEMIAAAPEQISQAGLALVPEGRGIFASLSVVENLQMSARAAGKANPWTMERIFELFPRLHERRGHGGQQLSGGEQQMLSIGRALMTNPDLLLVDEATEGLAPLICDVIWQTLDKIKADGVAVVVVDKDFARLSKLADRVIMLSKGDIVFNDTPAVLKASDGLLEKHLGI